MKLSFSLHAKKTSPRVSARPHIKEKRYRKPNPDRAWKLLLLGTLGLVVLAVLFHGFLFLSVAQTENVQAVFEDTGTKKINNTKLDAVLTRFAAKDEARAKLFVAPPPVVDPSV